MKGKKVGVWCCGNQPELYAALTKNGINPNNPSDVTIFNQPFDMNAFLSNQIDAAAAMTYNELAQVLETKNPNDRQALHALRPERLQDVGRRHGDARGQPLHDEQVAGERDEPGHAGEVPEGVVPGLDLLPRPPGGVRDIVLKNGPTLGAGHQAWQMNEINKLVWPNPSGIGVVPHRPCTRRPRSRRPTA